MVRQLDSAQPQLVWFCSFNKINNTLFTTCHSITLLLCKIKPISTSMLPEVSETLCKVSVSTTIEFFGLDESWSRQILWYQSQIKSSDPVLYSLDNFCLVSMFLWPRSRSWLWDSNLFSLILVIETQTFSVSISVSMIQILSHWSLIIYLFSYRELMQRNKQFMNAYGLTIVSISQQPAIFCLNI